MDTEAEPDLPLWEEGLAARHLGLDPALRKLQCIA